MITKVTITGADDSIDPQDLIELTNKYPFVEWGILTSKTSWGHTRFPSQKWVNELEDLSESHQDRQLSCHLCGQYVKDILLGKHDEILKMSLWIFDRIQINTHGQRHSYTKDALEKISNWPLEIIFQYDNANASIIEQAQKVQVNCSTLFDLSHGAGVLPSEWPDHLEGIRCGYAGGLGPDNLEEQIPIILEKAGDKDIWIDMETKVFSGIGKDCYFDLEKVEKCLEISSKFVNKKLKENG